MSIEEATNRAIGNAVNTAVEQEVSGMVAGYSNMMMYQLAYTQSFHMGGFGNNPDSFEEGEGTTWRVETNDRNDSYSYTSERALLKREEDGSTWWYLKFHSEDEDAIEYEVKINPEMEPLEMYYLNPDSREVEHYVFEQEERNNQVMSENEEDLEQDGFNTDYYHIEDWDEYREGEETVSVGNRSYNSQILAYSGQETENSEENVNLRWWVSEEVPGHLVKYEMINENDEGRVIGELVELSNNYTARFASF